MLSHEKMAGGAESRTSVRDPGSHFSPARASRGKGLVLTHSTDSKPVVAVEVAHALAARTEAKVPREVRVVRVERTRPVVAVAASAVERTAPTAASGGQKEAVAIGAS